LNARLLGLDVSRDRALELLRRVLDQHLQTRSLQLIELNAAILAELAVAPDGARDAKGRPLDEAAKAFDALKLRLQGRYDATVHSMDEEEAVIESSIEALEAQPASHVAVKGERLELAVEPPQKTSAQLFEELCQACAERAAP
jgi:hypothetical protein